MHRKDFGTIGELTVARQASVNHNQYEPRLFDDYADIKEALRDYTPLTLTNNVEGEEIVQTTTTQ